jgi:16S rRNA processing protein RimM
MNRDSSRQHSGRGEESVRIGEVVKPHGIRGEIKVHSYAGQPANFQDYEELILQQPDGGTAAYTITRCRVQGRQAILQLAGIASREEAEALRGSVISLRKGDFPRLAAGEYYWHQLVGLQVFTAAGKAVGEVTGLFSTAADDILVIRDRGREYLVPVNGEIIRNIDLLKKEVVIDPVPGLLEANEAF